MLPSAVYIVSLVLLGAALCGVAYLAVALGCAIAFGRRRSVPGAACPPLTVLKPVCGLEAELYENLCSFCDQNYPEFQVIFGVRDARDPAIPTIKRVLERYPSHDLELIVDGRLRAANPKIANLMNVYRAAKHEIVVIADADMRVGSEYLRAVAGTFADTRVGAATCVYSGVPSGGFTSALGAMFINDQFTPSVLVALLLGKLRFCFGATMAVRRSVLEAIGGLEALAPYLADDYYLGKLVSDAGYTVALAPCVAQNVLAGSDLPALLSRELRWARTIRTARPAGFAFSFITYGFTMALLYLLVSQNLVLGVPLLAAATALLAALHYVSRSALQAPIRSTPWLVPVRDLLGFCVWAASFFGREVRWRRSSLRVTAGGRVILAPAQNEAA